jgi:hypothetical protein
VALRLEAGLTRFAGAPPRLLACRSSDASFQHISVGITYLGAARNADAKRNLVALAVAALLTGMVATDAPAAGHGGFGGGHMGVKQ